MISRFCCLLPITRRCHHDRLFLACLRLRGLPACMPAFSLLSLPHPRTPIPLSRTPSQTCTKPDYHSPQDGSSRILQPRHQSPAPPARKQLNASSVSKDKRRRERDGSTRVTTLVGGGGGGKQEPCSESGGDHRNRRKGTTHGAPAKGSSREKGGMKLQSLGQHIKSVPISRGRADATDLKDKCVRESTQADGVLTLSTETCTEAGRRKEGGMKAVTGARAKMDGLRSEQVPNICLLFFYFPFPLFFQEISFGGGVGEAFFFLAMNRNRSMDYMG